ncbi:phage virion morphogenesis protein [Borrelia sp. RT1S]|uniref:phage virion morphogenesis protein n=1 Tax=Borrelia sp. RT1S TaxID=2898580 RepID=UPI001E59C7F3|nr:phage virion morphogenesis protein [Borrelia sp. RT1S]UGQ17873.1 phage virion morphogenesis protein [Borrelia sp. RT1S]
MLRFVGIASCKEKFFSFISRVKNKLNPVGNINVLNAMGEELVKISHDCFNRQSSPDGKAWEGLKASTIRKRRYFNKGTPHRRTGRRGSLKTSFGANKILFVDGTLKNSVSYYIKGKSLVVGSPLRFANIHMRGDRHKNIPARPFLGIRRNFQYKTRAIIKRFGGDF